MPNFRTTDAVRSDLNRAARLIERAAREADRQYNPKQAVNSNWPRSAPHHERQNRHRLV
jgi:hypothetical protein